MHSLGDIIGFNAKDSARAAKYGQARLEEADRASGNMDEPEYTAVMKQRELDRTALVTMLTETGAAGVISPHTDSIAPYMAFAGATVPYAKMDDGLNGCFLALHPDNAGALRLARTLEARFGLRFPPEDEVYVNSETAYPALGI